MQPSTTTLSNVSVKPPPYAPPYVRVIAVIDSGIALTQTETVYSATGRYRNEILTTQETSGRDLTQS